MVKVAKMKQKILIADDSEMNRQLLIEILGDKYEIVEVENGTRAVAALQDHAMEFSMLLLDIVMPEMDGFEVLAFMNKYHWIEDIPVIMISSETSSAYIERAYEFGVTDFISRPFDAAVVRRRVSNTMLLAARQRKLMDIVTDQIYEKDKSDKLMISILSHIVEFRNGESGLHVLHINAITELLLNKLIQKSDRYSLTQSDINIITMASALHDIGKISVPDEVLNKPGRLTAEEFEIMKRHSLVGAEMLEELPESQKKEQLVKVAYEICRWHHERYDGGGYPDGLVGDQIPISAQVVALADVYDALTSERCYKKAFTHERAMEMILGGQCGVFNPLLLECLTEVADVLKNEIKIKSQTEYSVRDMQSIAEQLRNYELPSSEQIILRQGCERQEYQFLIDTAEVPIFRYTAATAMLSLNEAGRNLLAMDDLVINPLENSRMASLIDGHVLEHIMDRLRKTTPDNPIVKMDIPLRIHDEDYWFRCQISTLWTAENETQYTGLIGRLTDTHSRHHNAKMSPSKSLDELRKLNLSKSYPQIRNMNPTMTGEEAWELLQELQGIFDLVRLVDAAVNIQVTVNEDGEVCQTPHRCYCIWDKKERCSNCISAKCISCRNRQGKFEFLNNEVYFIWAVYVEIDGEPYSLELINKITDETLMCGYGSEELVEYISEHNEKLYMDPVTGVYNRRYYEEQLKGLWCVEAVAMIDVDRFKYINDSYGHQTGDLALKMIADAIKKCIRKSDAVVRYGGDEFVVVFRNIPERVFEEKMEDIRQRVGALYLEDAPELKFSLSIGGVYGRLQISELLREADERMYEVKREKNNHQ